MCKIFAITNVSKVVVTTKFLQLVQDEVCANDPHGFGYAVSHKSGSIWGERTLSPGTFTKQIDKSDSRASMLRLVKTVANKFGTHTTQGNNSLIAHGRYSTNTVSLPNTHPFVGSGVALIHNGIVRDMAKTPIKTKTDNDSEILFQYWNRDGMKGIERNVSGYYAMAVLDALGQLHIVRDNKAMLYITYSRTIESFIVATTPSIIQNVAKGMKWSIEVIEEVNPNTHTVFKVNNVVSHTPITPLAVESEHFADKASLAFGYRAEEEAINDDTLAMDNLRYLSGHSSSEREEIEALIKEEEYYKSGY